MNIKRAVSSRSSYSTQNKLEAILFRQPVHFSSRTPTEITIFHQKKKGGIESTWPRCPSIWKPSGFAWRKYKYNFYDYHNRGNKMKSTDNENQLSRKNLLYIYMYLC